MSIQKNLMAGFVAAGLLFSGVAAGGPPAQRVDASGPTSRPAHDATLLLARHGKIQREVRRVQRRVGAEAQRVEQKVGAEVKRATRRTENELKRFAQRLQKNQSIGLLVQGVVAMTLGPQALVLLNTIQTVHTLARSQGKEGDLLRAGLAVLGPSVGNPSGQAILSLAQNLGKLRTKRGREEFIQSVLASQTGIDVNAIERRGTKEGREQLLAAIANPVERSETAALFHVIDRVDSMNLGPGQNPQALIQGLASVIGSPEGIRAAVIAWNRAAAESARDFSTANHALQTSTAPALLNLPYPRAMAVLENVGLKHRVVSYVQTANASLDDRVASQDPPSGFAVGDDTAVSLYLYKAPQPRPIKRPIKVTKAPAPPLLPTPAPPMLPTPGPPVLPRPAPATKPEIASISPDPATPGAIITIHGRNFNPNAAANLIRLLIDSSSPTPKLGKVVGQRGPSSYDFRAIQASADGTSIQLQLRLPQDIRPQVAHLLVHNGSAYGSYFRFRVAPPSGATAAAIVPNLLNQPIGSALSRLQDAGFRPAAIGFQDTPNCNLSQRIAAQNPPPGGQLPRGSRVQLSVYWCGGG